MPDLNKLPPPMQQDPDYRPAPRDPSWTGPHVVADIYPLEGQLKMGEVTGFTIRCDEAIRADGSGGTGTAPSPLGYFTTAIGF